MTSISPTEQAAPAKNVLGCATDFQGAYEELAKKRSGTEPTWLENARAEAMQRFRKGGLPSRKSELWRYTNLTGFGRKIFSTAPAEDNAEAASDGQLAERIALHTVAEGSTRLVFLNGIFAAHLSTPLDQAPVTIQSLSKSSFEDLAERSTLFPQIVSFERPFLDLNTAFFGQVTVLRVAAGEEVREPVHLLYLTAKDGGATQSSANFPRVAVDLGPGSRATLVEEHLALDTTADLVAPVTTVHLGQGAALQHIRVQDCDREAFFFASVDVTLQKDATWRGVSMQFGGALSRDEVRAKYAGSGGDFEFFAMGLSDGERVTDSQVEVIHDALNCKSRQTYRGVADDRGRAIFNSRVAVERDAQGSDTGQSSKSLIFSEHAVAHTKPQLEVLADDVKCFHGATVGQLDENAFFFLRSRGIGAHEARAMLTTAFAGEVILAIPDATLRNRLSDLLGERLAIGSRAQAAAIEPGGVSKS